MRIITDPRCTEYSTPGHPERPARIEKTVAYLKRDDGPTVEWYEPLTPSVDQIERTHAAEHVERVKNEEEFDADTPAYSGIHAHAMRSVGGALKALELSKDGKPVMSLLRPPGHHATKSRAMGFCYLNSIAVAALEAKATGLKSVCVFDFDVHHGNGTEHVLKDVDGVHFFSVHQHPCYPGTGTENVGKNCFNHTVSPGLDRWEYRKILKRAFQEMLAKKPDLIAVSAGFDGYSGDPLAQMTLEAADFEWLGELVAKSKVRSFSILEGGYSDDLPELVESYLKGLSFKE